MLFIICIEGGRTIRFNHGRYIIEENNIRRFRSLDEAEHNYNKKRTKGLSERVQDSIVLLGVIGQNKK